MSWRRRPTARPGAPRSWKRGRSGRGSPCSGAGSAAVAAYVTADGAVHAAAWDGAAWTVSEVATGSAPSATSGLGAPSTGVSLGADGIARVAWQDDTGVHLASGSGGSFSKVETPGTEGGAGPSVAAGPNGNVYLAWYDAGKKNLMVGVLGDCRRSAAREPKPGADGVPRAGRRDLVRRRREGRPRHPGQEHHVRPHLSGGAGRRTVHGELRQPRRGDPAQLRRTTPRRAGKIRRGRNRLPDRSKDTARLSTRWTRATTTSSATCIPPRCSARSRS